MTLRELKLFGFGFLGVLGTAAAAALAVAPDAFAGVLPLLQRLSGQIRPTWLVAAIGLLGVFVGWQMTESDRGQTAFDDAVSTPPESVTTAETPLTGAPLDTMFDEAVAGDPNAMTAMVDRLRATAVTAYAIDAECSREAAERAIESGAWTGDAVATAMFDPDTAQPLPARLRLWLDPESERERRLRRTVRAIERLGEGR
ncbi:hypothetical protein NDI56_11090 [Haloarcula sp. S1CR25-12]|uniref:Uncharacterized protein n=1 Tax=Haloarcula saliterrae TaxID=2950534 RepID=A0ABU2FCE9_9EURY|nr:hypothetical protein [Haloarcula sp. S1CR25-12]MDS0259939.1 hypothetical protein [Haloarcula sp. S1CR25-12]